jgi:uncharacterized phage protein (TIGR01671 family)
MREIEFRGKRRDNSRKWCYGNFQERNGHFAIHEKTHFSDADEDCYVGHAVYTETVGQYTGLKDRNGRKIFEGDILSARVMFNSDERFYLPVAYSGARFVLKIMERDYSVSLDEYYHDAEIAGNIHDNPGLLNGEGDAE